MGLVVLAVRGLLNSEKIEKRLGHSDVYDGSVIQLTPNRVTDSRGIPSYGDKNTAIGKGKRASRQRQREANCTELRASAEEIGNRPIADGDAGNDAYR